MLAHETALLASNVSLLANNLLAKSNALLGPYGILVELSFTRTNLLKFSAKQSTAHQQLVPTGLEFSLIDSD